MFETRALPKTNKKKLSLEAIRVEGSNQDQQEESLDDIIDELMDDFDNGNISFSQSDSANM